MAPFKQARLMSVVLLFLTLAAGILIGMAWSERGGDGDSVPMEVLGPAQPTDDPEEPADADQGDDPEARDATRDERPEGERRRGPVIYELDLEPDQRTTVDGLIQHFRIGLEELDDEMAAEMWRRRGALASALRDSIKAVLRPEQAALYDSLLTVRYSRSGSDRGDRGRDGDGRGDGRERDRDGDGRDDGRERDRHPDGRGDERERDRHPDGGTTGAHRDGTESERDDLT